MDYHYLKVIGVSAVLSALLSTGLVQGDEQFRFLSAGSDVSVVVRPNRYDYAPSVMVRNGRYEVWWCAAIRAGQGDTILHSSLGAGQLEKQGGVDAAGEISFSNSGDPSTFDGRHTCDPSVIKIGGRSYLYYGGLAKAKGGGDDARNVTKLGVAVSDDGGGTWRRGNQGNPILAPRPVRESDESRYGLGQPSAIFHDGYVYLLYTNSLGNDGPGLYVARSRNPLFTEREEWTPNGFVGSTSDSPARGDRLMPGASADWAFVPGRNVFVIALRKTEGVMQLVLFDRELKTRVGALDLPLQWTEGPGLARDELGNLVFTENRDGSISFYLFRSIGVPRKPPTWDIAATRVTALLGGRH